MIYSIVTSALNKNLRQDQIKLNRLRKICLNYVVTDVGLSFREPTSSFCTADGMHIAAIFVYDTHKHWTVNAQHDDWVYLGFNNIIMIHRWTARRLSFGSCLTHLVTGWNGDNEFDNWTRNARTEAEKENDVAVASTWNTVQLHKHIFFNDTDSTKNDIIAISFDVSSHLEEESLDSIQEDVGHVPHRTFLVPQCHVIY